MIDNTVIGKKVTHKSATLGDGTIIAIKKDYITVDFGHKVSTFLIETFDQFFSFDDEQTREIIMSEISAIKTAKAAAESAKKAAEEATKKAAEEAAQKAAAQANSKEKKPIIHPYIDQRRSNGKHVIFLVCQNGTYEIESKNGFIWAPTHTDKGETDFASHAQLDQVKTGDIIIHHFANRVWAISVAKKDCELKEPVPNHPGAGIVGRYVELSCHILDNPADTSGLKEEKITYGSMKYGPFEKTGKNKEGFYLSEVADELAKVFIDAAIAANPEDAVLVDFKKEI